MDYKDLALEFMEVMNQTRRRNVPKQIDDSMRGEHFVLNYISEHEGNVIPSDISHEMGITSARVAAALNSLEKKGLITRRIDAGDRRRILIDMTDAGREQVKKHYEMILDTTIDMLRYLGEEDAKNYIRIMKKMAGFSHENFR
ncbi:MarR family transcriptional regulator [Lachnospiraceae bacterium 54-53]